MKREVRGQGSRKLHRGTTKWLVWLEYSKQEERVIRNELRNRHEEIGTRSYRIGISKL